MNDTKLCPQCGKPVSPEALLGLCADCMFKAGLASQAECAQPAPGKAEPAVPPPPVEIASLFPRLEISECLGRGGMGMVYKARQTNLDRYVALKILAGEKQDDPKFAERFAREARALARLNHPNIVTVYEFGEAGGHYYLLMEYVDGLNLRQLLQAGTLKPERAVAIVPAICEALQYAHDQGVVHRDIKPENILLDRNGRVKIADFGIAKIFGRQDGPSRLTAEQQVVGTPHYIAPEQVERPQLVDHRADIYSLGVVFYEMLTGELPLGEFAPPSAKAPVYARLDQVVLRALAKEPERRYQQARQVKTDIQTIADTPHVSGPPLAPSDSTGGLDRPATAARRPWSGTRKKITAPAIGLMGASLLQLLSLLNLFLLSGGLGGQWIEAADWIRRAALVMTLAKVIPAPFIFVGAVQMLRLRSYAWAVAAAILAIVSFGLISFPIGIWALVVLTRSGAREAFPSAPQPQLG